MPPEPDLRNGTRPFSSGDLQRHGAPARQQRHTHVRRDGALDPFETRQRHEDVGRDVVLLEQSQHAIADMRWIVVRNHGVPSAFGQRHLFVARERVRRIDQHHQLVVPEDDGAELWLRGLESEDAEVECPLGDLRPDLARRDSPDIDMNEWVRVPEPGDERQHDVN